MGETDQKLQLPQEEHFASGRARLSPGEKDFINLTDAFQIGKMIRIVPEEPHQELLESDPLPAPTIYLRGVFPHKDIRPDEIGTITIEQRPGEGLPVIVRRRGPSMATQYTLCRSDERLPLEEGPLEIYGSKDAPLLVLRFIKTGEGDWLLTFTKAFDGKGKLETARDINRQGIPDLQALEENLKTHLNPKLES